MKTYQRRFVLLIMGLFVLVLAISFVAIAVNQYQSLNHEIQLILLQKLSPGARDMRRGAPPPPMPPEGESEYPPLGMIITTRLDRRTGQIVTETRNPDLSDEEVAALIEASKDRPERYGLLKQYGMAYLKLEGYDGIRFAFISSDHINRRMISLIRTLVFVLLAAAAIMYPIGRCLSRVAVKPLTESYEREKQLTLDISHDLKTPLSVIMASENLLRAESDHTVAEEIRHVDHIRASAETMLQMINGSLELSRVETLAEMIPKKQADISYIVEQTCLTLEPLAYDKGIALDLQIQPGIKGMTNPEYIGRITGCLVENAIKYEPADGGVTVRLHSGKRSAFITVSNQYSQIREEDREHIFERYYRGDKARTEKSGFGLGLAIAREMVRALGGDIRISEAEESVAFVVTLPLAEL